MAMFEALTMATKWLMLVAGLVALSWGITVGMIVWAVWNFRRLHGRHMDGGAVAVAIAEISAFYGLILMCLVLAWLVVGVL